MKKELELWGNSKGMFAEWVRVDIIIMRQEGATAMLASVVAPHVLLRVCGHEKERTKERHLT